jgi:hypothetical protein
MAELSEILPVLTPLHEDNALSSDTVFSRNFPFPSRVGTNLENVSFREFVISQSFAVLMSPVKFFIRTVSPLSVVSKIFNSVIQRIVIVMTDMKSIRFANERGSDDSGNRDLSPDILLKQVNFFTLTSHAGFEDSFLFTRSFQRSDSPQIACHVQTFIPRHVFPDFSSHMHHIVGKLPNMTRKF